MKHRFSAPTRAPMVEIDPNGSPQPQRHKARVSLLQESPTNNATSRYLDHLNKWACNHDCAPYFHGRLFVLGPVSKVDELDLWKYVSCLLCYELPTREVKKRITIRLFPPAASPPRVAGGPPQTRSSRYSMVVRHGSGWIRAKEYFEKEQSAQMALERKRVGSNRDAGLSSQTEVLPKAAFVKIQPLFTPFMRLPLELQSHILALAIHKQPTYSVGSGGGFKSTLENLIFPKPSALGPWQVYLHPRLKAPDNLRPLSLTNVYLILPSLTSYMRRWVLRSTDFYFESSGMTEFLRMLGPVNRADIRMMTLNFGPRSLLHCIRWFAPDAVFSVLGSPLGGGMHHFWRCQLQDLVKELHLDQLTLIVTGLSHFHCDMAIRLILYCFKHVQRVKVVDFRDPRRNACRNAQEVVSEGLEQAPWAVMCHILYETIKHAPEQEGYMYFGSKQLYGTTEDLVRAMKGWEFFHDEHDLSRRLFSLIE